jgi:peptide/nickel transport system substrate-binding protein
MTKSEKVSRRRFLTISATSTVAGLLAACSGSAQQPAATTAPASTAAPAAGTAAPAAGTAAATNGASAFKEAPMLAELVAQGKLPPVAERLPKAPLVVQTLQEIGQYGGTWRMGMEEDDNVMVLKSILYDGMVRWNAEWTDVVPNIAESWEIEDGGKKYTFKLHEGIKWSDGTPFTTADIMFWVESVRANEELHGDQPSWMQITVDGEDEDAKVTAIDEYTISVEWSQPNGLFLQRLATPPGLEMTHYQAEYVRQWLPEFNPDVEKLAQEQQLPSWIELWDQKAAFDVSAINARNQNPELPTLYAWVITSRLGDGQLFTAERNPYYWKVDSEGQQLPYIDNIAYNVVADREVLLLSALNGEIDLQDRRIGDLRNKAVLVDGQEKGNFRFFNTNSSNMNTDVISLNLTHKDAAKREMYGNKQFRQALSIALNRQQMIDLVYVSQGQPWQAAPHPESEFYDQEFATQFTEYDPDQANAILDELGYARGADGMRVGPDGNPINIVIEVDRDRDPLATLITDWEAIGIKGVVSKSERTLFRERTKNNDHDATGWSGNAGLGLDVLMTPSFYMPFDQESHFAMAWRLWADDPEDELAEEPSEPAKKQIELYQQLKSTADREEQVELMKQILQIAKEEFYVIGIALPATGFGIVSNTFGNVPETMFDAYNWPQPAAAGSEQFFIRAG